MLVNKITNFRDISGYTNEDGKSIRDNKIFRGGSLFGIDYSVRNYLYEQLRIKNVVDLRDSNEASIKPDPEIKGINYYNVNALENLNNEDGFDFGSILGSNPSSELISYAYQYLIEGYKSMPLNNKAFMDVFEIMLKNEGGIYIHCSAGKDRTGVISYLIMKALNFSDEIALQEYLKSNDYIEKNFSVYINNLGISVDRIDEYKPLLFVNKEFINYSIQSIFEEYNSYEEYFEYEYNLNKQKISKLKQIYLS